MAPEHGVELFWIPLGAGSRLPVVRWSGRAYEAVQAVREHRPRQALFHAALVVRRDGTWYAIEMAPDWGPGSDAGAVVAGPVGLRPLGRSRFFRYQVRCREQGVIPDLASAVGGPHLLTDQRDPAQRVLDAVPNAPQATWGRDELHLGEMWNSNSLIAWLLERSGLGAVQAGPPGRAPGWRSGMVLAQRNDSTGGHEQTR